jgi:hypothetical protein
MSIEELTSENERLKKKYNQVREIWLATDSSFAKYQLAVKQYVEDKGDDYDKFKADYLD